MSQEPPIQERIRKVGDLHVAVCARPLGAGEFVGFFNVFRDRPVSFFAPGCVLAGSGRFAFASSEGALVHVEKLATEALQRLSEDRLN